MVIHTNGNNLRVAVVASTRLGSDTARVAALASFYEYLFRSGVLYAVHPGGLLGSKWRPTSRHPVLDYPNVGVTTLHYPAIHPERSQIGQLMKDAGRDDWVELDEPTIDIIGPDGTAVRCHLVLDPLCHRFAAAFDTPGPPLRRSLGGVMTVPPDSLFLFGGNPRCAIRRNRAGGACLIQSGSRFNGPGATGAILTVPIEPGGFIRERGVEIETWRYA
jgi:hypothetical protein